MLKVGGIANLALLGRELKESLSYALKAGNFLMVLKIQTIHAHFLEIMGKRVREWVVQKTCKQGNRGSCTGEAATKSCGRSEWGSSDTTDAGKGLSCEETMRTTSSPIPSEKDKASTSMQTDSEVIQQSEVAFISRKKLLGYALSSVEGHLEMEFFDLSQSKKPLLTCYVNRQEEDEDSDEGRKVEEYVLKLGGVTAKEKLLSVICESLWKEIDGSFWFQGHWYIFPKEKAARRQPHNSKRELYRTNDFADNEMETVLRDCYVMTPNEYVKTVNEGDDVFLCEYEYDVKYHSFKRIAETDNHEEDDGEAEHNEDWSCNKDSESESDDDIEYEKEEKFKSLHGSTLAHVVAAAGALKLALQIKHNVRLGMRSSILTREVLPKAKDDFVIISREESHRGIPNTSVKTEKPQVSTFNTKFNDANKRKGFGNWSNGNSSGNWRDDFDVVEGLEVQEEHSRCCQAKDSNDKEKLVHGKMVVKFEVLRVRDEEVVVAEGVVVISSSLDMLTNSCLEGIMVSLIFLEELEEEAFIEFMVE
nr:origin of replication complex subunit 1A-like [Tanacetum cinerariifolium]